MLEGEGDDLTSGELESLRNAMLRSELAVHEEVTSAARSEQLSAQSARTSSDLIELVVDITHFYGEEAALAPEWLDLACASYFVDTEQAA